MTDETSSSDCYHVGQIRPNSHRPAVRTVPMLPNVNDLLSFLLLLGGFQRTFVSLIRFKCRVPILWYAAEAISHAMPHTF